jgi:hypothetical protein
MKDLRSLHVAAVKAATFKELELQTVNKNSKDIMEWKKSKRVKECYEKLYDEDDDTVGKIAKRAFPNIPEGDEKFEKIYIYTAAICDIVLNPKYPDIECSKKPLQRRYQKFKVFGEFYFYYYLKSNFIELIN